MVASAEQAETESHLILGLSLGAGLSHPDMGPGPFAAGDTAYLDRAAVLADAVHGVQEAGAIAVAARGVVTPVKPGSFSVFDWAGYPSGVARPSGPFRLVQGAEYDAARKAANQANAALRRADPAKYAGKQIHEIHPVKFGGSPTDPANKIALTPAEHAKYTTFWNRLMRDIQ